MARGSRRRAAPLRSISFDRQRQHLGGALGAARLGGLATAVSLVTGRRPPRHDEQVRCDLYRYSYFDGRLSIAGRVRSETDRIVGIGMRIPGRRWMWLEPGLVAQGDPEPDGWSGFSFSIPCGDVPTSLGWRLCAALSDGSWIDLGQARHRAAASNDFDRTMQEFWSLLSDRPPGRLLEVGARARSGFTHIEGLPAGWDYVGFDIVDGPNVHVQGDAHELSSHFEAESFDAVLSISTFEHLAMPWVAAVEINKVLKPGGLVCVATHQTWNVHEAPWDYWRFSEYSWPVLFNASTGFEMVRAAMGQQAQIVAVLMNDVTAGLPGAPAFLGTIAIARKTAPSRLTWDVRHSDVVKDHYPS